ncbi:unnamed protein product, partial [Angiostrongylus costaricensis]|uniref:Tetraspanin n=1 Tax=Angiostrongylus costaricensis TaxID=334426 RepID=A0A158PG41_ANGCS
IIIIIILIIINYLIYIANVNEGYDTCFKVVGTTLIVIGFALRFGRGFGTFNFETFQINDFLELERLDMVFGLFTSAASVLVLLFFMAVYATVKKASFFCYCAVMALMVVVQLVAGLLAFTYSDQVNQLASDDILYESLNRTASKYASPPPKDDETQFWIYTQDMVGYILCCSGCEKQIHSRISKDVQYLGAASMAVILIETIASFLAGYRAYTIAHPDDG